MKRERSGSSRFDGKDHPRAATAAIAVACRLFWALGYYQVESYISSVRLHGPRRRRRRPHQDPVRPRAADDDEGRPAACSSRSEPNADGSYRVLAARALPGRVVGGFRYYGTRPDDPNDVVPHEHRRELRALKVFGAWTNLTDMKAGNTLDTVITENGRSVVRHYLQDVGSTFGTGALERKEPDDGSRAPLRGRSAREAHGDAGLLPPAVAGTCRIRRRPKSDASKATTSSPRNGRRACRRAPSSAPAPTTRSGRRCASWPSATS